MQARSIRQRWCAIILMVIVAWLPAVLLGGSAAGAVDNPRLVPFQGRLVDEHGDPRVGVFRVTFRIYDVPQGGLDLWTETHENVSIINGQINVLLGSITSLDDPGSGKAPVTFAAQKYLGITIGTDSNQEMVPRHELVPAFHARTADRAFMADDIADSAVTTVKLADNAVTTSKLVDGSVTASKIAAGAVGIDKIQNSVQSASPALSVTNTGSGDAIQGYAPNGAEGVLGQSDHAAGIGVRGVTTSATGQGVVGLNVSAGTTVDYAKAVNSGVFGFSANGANAIGVTGIGRGSGSFGVWGFTETGTAGVRGVTHAGAAGVSGVNDKTNGIGVDGDAAAGTGVRGHTVTGPYGVWGVSDNQSGIGVYGGANVVSGGIGVEGFSPTGVGLEGKSVGGIAIRAYSTASTITMRIHNLMGDFLDGCASDENTCTGPEKTFRIDHTGRGFFAGGTQTGGVDIAEIVDATQPLSAGDVIEIDPAATSHFRLTTSEYSTRVAGIVSTAPGVTLSTDVNETGSPLHPILALAGRVPVKVTTANGPIAPGDLLTSSPIPGRAMRCGDQARCTGAIVGKALESAGPDTSVIQALVTLQ